MKRSTVSCHSGGEKQHTLFLLLLPSHDGCFTDCISDSFQGCWLADSGCKPVIWTKEKESEWQWQFLPSTLSQASPFFQVCKLGSRTPAWRLPLLIYQVCFEITFKKLDSRRRRAEKKQHFVGVLEVLFRPCSSPDIFNTVAVSPLLISKRVLGDNVCQSSLLFFKDDILLVSEIFSIYCLDPVACRIFIPWGSSLFLLHWEFGMLTPGPPGKSQCHSSIYSVWCMRHVPKWLIYYLSRHHISASEIISTLTPEFSCRMWDREHLTHFGAF